MGLAAYELPPDLEKGWVFAMRHNGLSIAALGKSVVEQATRPAISEQRYVVRSQCAEIRVLEAKFCDRDRRAALIVMPTARREWESTRTLLLVFQGILRANGAVVRRSATLLDLCPILASAEDVLNHVQCLVGRKHVHVSLQKVTGDRARALTIEECAPWRRRLVGTTVVVFFSACQAAGEADRKYLGVERISAVKHLLCSTPHRMAIAAAASFCLADNDVRFPAP